MEKKKLQFGCSVGIPIGLLVAVLTAWFLTPMFWWLGIIAGLYTGYLCYDLKEVRIKAPTAWQLAKKKGSTYSLDWLKQPHLIFWPSLIFSGVFMYFILQSIWWSNFLGEEKISIESKIFSLISTLIVVIYFGVLLFSLSIFGFAKIGAKKKKVFWQPSEFFTKEEVEKMIEENYQEILPTYKNIYGLALTELIVIAIRTVPIVLKAIKGIGGRLKITFWFLFYGMWVLLGRFVWMLVKLIHSHKRIICGMDCAVGVFVTYKILGTRTETIPQLVGLLACGALIGFTIGTIHAKIIKHTRLAVLFNNH